MKAQATQSMPRFYSPACRQDSIEKSEGSPSKTPIKHLSVRSTSFEEIYENARDEESVGNL